MLAWKLALPAARAVPPRRRAGRWDVLRAVFCLPSCCCSWWEPNLSAHVVTVDLPLATCSILMPAEK